MAKWLSFCCFLTLVSSVNIRSSWAENKSELRVAVASNFALAAKFLFADFEEGRDVTIVPLIGSTGKHVAQIQRGLKVDVFLAADRRRPEWLVDNELAVPGTRFTYALGQLGVFSLSVDALDLNVLRGSLAKKQGLYIAIANPKLAPYGVAAEAVLTRLGIINDNGALENDHHLIKGENVAQTFQFAANGAADIALISYSQAKSLRQGYFRLVNSTWHAPIEQDAIIIQDSAMARDFMAYMKGESARNIIRESGYLLAPLACDQVSKCGGL